MCMLCKMNLIPWKMILILVLNDFACAGIEPVLDMRSKKDLDGNPLKVTFQAVVDNLATIANHKMGEGAESRPFAIVRDSGAKLTDREIKSSEMAIAPEQCVYVRGLSNPPKNQD